MECKEARGLFTDLHDGDLPEAKRAELQEHVAKCPECRREWESYRQVVDEVSGLHPIEPSDDFFKQIEQKIHRRSRGRFFSQESSHSVRFAIISFVLILLFILTYLFLSAGDEIVLVNDDQTSKLERDAAVAPDPPHPLPGEGSSVP